jgi:hypothetical protein
LSAVADARAIYIRDALGGEELYDPIADPDEVRDLAGSPPSRPALTRCREALERALAPP